MSPANSDATSPWNDDHADALAQEHARIQELLEGLSEAAGPAILGRTLEALRPLLVSHFAEEERPGGFYDDIERARPHLASRIRGLREQHRTSLEALDGLSRAVTTAPRPFEPHASARDALIRQLARHEGAESRLISEAWWRDLGDGD
jgi:hypothetical protein